MKCFVPGCTAAVFGRCKTFGDGCKEHLDRWSTSSFRVRSRGEDKDAAATARADFIRLLSAEQINATRPPKEP